MKRTRNGILIPDVPIMAGGNLPNAVKGVSAGGEGGFDPSRLPFYIDVRGTVTLDATSGLQMSTDGKNWTDTVKCELPTGKTYFRVASDQTSPLYLSYSQSSDADYDIGGNINSLVKKDFENDTTCYNFGGDYGRFQYKTKLKSASNLILPATTLVSGCYRNMFNGCTSLTAAPELPATTLADSCYTSMFSGCTSLTVAPELPAMTTAQNCCNSMFFNCTALTTAPSILPATTLAQGCYQTMFKNCTSLTTAPELPASTLAKSCYYGMFSGCSNLNYIKCLATKISASGCTGDWVSGVASSGTFVKAASMSGWTTGNNGIPTGWTVEEID